MLSLWRLKHIACKLSMLRPRHCSLRLVASSAAEKHNVARHTRAVIFDMGGVLIPSPLPFLAGKQCCSVICVIFTD